MRLQGSCWIFTKWLFKEDMAMNILVYLGHPAQYHFFKNTLKNLVKDGNRFLILIKTKDILEDLVREDGWEYENIQPKVRGGSILSILTASLRRLAKVISRARKFQADILVGTDSSIAQSAWLLRKSSITTLEDDVDVIRNLARLTYPFSSTILVPDVCHVGKWERKKIPYYGYMKLAYLHPSYFTPDRTVLERYKISGRYILVRLARLTAHHDIGIKGLNTDLVLKIKSVAEKNGYNVYVSAEGDLDNRLKYNQLKIKFTDIHHIMAYASMLVSDSQSMSMEAAMLGLPSLRFSDFAGRISVLEELEKEYGLTFGIFTSEPEKLLDKVSELLANHSLEDEFSQRRQKMLAEKIDVTAFLTWFLENYPQSRKIMKENPDYQLRFK